MQKKKKWVVIQTVPILFYLHSNIRAIEREHFNWDRGMPNIGRFELILNLTGTTTMCQISDNRWQLTDYQ